MYADIIKDSHPYMLNPCLTLLISLAHCFIKYDLFIKTNYIFNAKSEHKTEFNGYKITDYRKFNSNS